VPGDALVAVHGRSVIDLPGVGEASVAVVGCHRKNPRYANPGAGWWGPALRRDQCEELSILSLEFQGKLIQT